jgi:hypothetical protein
MEKRKANREDWGMNLKPTDKQLTALWQKCVKARAGWKSEISGGGSPICGHHIFHKPNLRLRYSLEFGVCLTNAEHARYHYYEKCAFPKDRKIADDMRIVFLNIRGETEEKAMIFKRQTGGTDHFALKIYLENELKKYEGKNAQL